MYNTLLSYSSQQGMSSWKAECQRLKINVQENCTKMSPSMHSQNRAGRSRWEKSFFPWNYNWRFSQSKAWWRSRVFYQSCLSWISLYQTAIYSLPPTSREMSLWLRTITKAGLKCEPLIANTPSTLGRGGVGSITIYRTVTGKILFVSKYIIPL